MNAWQFFNGEGRKDLQTSFWLRLRCDVKIWKILKGAVGIDKWQKTVRIYRGGCLRLCSFGQKSGVSVLIMCLAFSGMRFTIFPG